MDNRIIFLVEDDADDVDLTLRAFKKSRIAQKVVAVRDGVEALDYLFGTGTYAGRDPGVMPAVVLLDLKLPRLNGIEVLQRLRADARTRLLPVVVLTSSKEDRDLIDSYHNGCNSYVRKPVDFNKFAEAIANLGLYWLVLNELPPPIRGK